MKCDLANLLLYHKPSKPEDVVVYYYFLGLIFLHPWDLSLVVVQW